VGGTINENFLTKVGDDDLRKSILQKQSKSFQYKMDGLSHYVTYAFSNKLNWSIVKLTSFGELNEKIIVIRNSTLIVSVLVLLVAILILLALSKNVQLPVENVLNKLKELEIEKKGSYHSLRNTFLKKVLEEYIDPLTLAEQMVKYSILFDVDSAMTLISLKIDNYNQFCNTYDSKDRESIFLKMKENTIEEFSKYCRNEVVEYEKDNLVVIANSDIHKLDELKMIMTKLQTDICNSLKISISCVVSNTINNYEDIPAEIANMRELINYRLIYGYSSIILSRDLLEKSQDAKYEYPTKKEKQLFNQLLLGKQDNVMEIFYEMIEEAKKYSYNSLMILLNRLVFALNNVVERLGSESKLYINFDFYYLSKTINMLETLDEIIGEFSQVFETISNSLIINPEDKSSKMVSMVYDYIEKNYSNSNLSVNLIAEYLGKLPVYVNRIFKSSTGNSVQSSIDDYRLKKSMELLVESSINVKEISNMIGMVNEKYYYFLFKKNMGITPGEYRNRNRDK
jgi:AraC-like DNA-binding protein